MRERVIEVLLKCGICKECLESVNFLEEELIDSLMVAEIVIGIEDEFEIEIDGEDIIPDNFLNIDMIEMLVSKYVSTP